MSENKNLNEEVVETVEATEVVNEAVEEVAETATPKEEVNQFVTKENLDKATDTVKNFAQQAKTEDYSVITKIIQKPAEHFTLSPVLMGVIFLVLLAINSWYQGNIISGIVMTAVLIAANGVLDYLTTKKIDVKYTLENAAQLLVVPAVFILIRCFNISLILYGSSYLLAAGAILTVAASKKYANLSYIELALVCALTFVIVLHI